MRGYDAARLSCHLRFARVVSENVVGLRSASPLIIRPPTDQQNILTFLDDVPGETHSAPSITDPTFSRGQDVQAPFSDWFSRPLRIASIPWAEGSNIAELVTPWHAYFSNPEVYSKIKGFSRLRCKLHVKLLINASPFQYSLGVMSYRPLSGKGDIRPYSGGDLYAYETPTNSIANMISYTQMPHAHFEPQYSKGCEMELPFIYHSDWIPLTQTFTVGSAVYDLPTLREMGSLTIASYAILRTVGNATANPITVSLYAWATDVELAGPSMVLQSKDEYSVKPVSSTAYAVAAAAGKLEAIPAIAPFARATGVVANSLGTLAAAFGFSNPPVIDPVSSMRINYGANLSSTDIPTQIEKLSLDPKNELTVDARTVGLDGVDHMSLKHVLDRNVFFTSFQWNASDAPDYSLFSTFINPSIVEASTYVDTNATDTTVRQMQMTPSAFVGTMFNNWRGPITIKFVAAASQFHRGRLRISYDPSRPWASDQTGAMRLYQKVWDLTVSNTFEYTIPYMAATSWLGTRNDFLTDENPNNHKFWVDRASFSSIPAYYNPSVFNGALRVDVMSELTAPSAVAVPIFVYINASEVEFADPADVASRGQLSLIKLQSLDAVTVKDQVVAEELPIVDNINHIHDVYMGEKVSSLRNLVHRSTYWDTIRPAFVGSTLDPAFPVGFGLESELMNRWVIPRLPMGFFVNGVNTTGNGTADGLPPWSVFNNVGTVIELPELYGCNARTSPLSLITACYVGWRGSVVWRAFIERSAPTQINGTTVSAPVLSSLVMRRDRRNMAIIRPNNNSALFGAASNKYHTLQDGAVIGKSARTPYGTTTTGFLKIKNTTGLGINSKLRNDFCGVSKGTPSEVPVVDAIFPHYSGLRMMSSNPKFYYAQNTGVGTVSQVSGLQLLVENTTQVDEYDTFTIDAKYDIPEDGVNPEGRGLSGATAITLYSSAGVDFTCFMFLAVPTMWMYLKPNDDASITTSPPLFQYYL